MHYYALAIVPADGDLDELVQETLAPYDENLELEEYEEDGETYSRNPHGLWDWYQIGGRWTGTLSGYDPEKDPTLREVCFICHGTGIRNDPLGRHTRARNPGYTCNGCDGEGMSPLWPTEWPRHGGDIVPAEDFTARLAELPDYAMPYAIFAHGSESVTVKDRWNSDTYVAEHDNAGMRAVLATILAARMHAGLKDRVVVIDYHN